MDKRKAVLIAKKYLSLIRGIVNYKSAFIFGSYIHGNPREDSDIDIGIFTEKLNDEYFNVLKKLYKARKKVDPRIEPHLFVSGCDSSGFNEEIREKGLLII